MNKPVKRMTVQNYQFTANEEGVPLHTILARYDSDHINNPLFWTDVTQFGEEGAFNYEPIIDIKFNDILTAYSKAIAEQVKFPVSTVFMHGLGVIASAMTKSFTVACEGDLMPCNLYVITAQPPSTGKSGVNKLFFNPVNDAYKDLNERTRTKRTILTKKLEKLEAELAKSDDEYEVQELTDKLIDVERELSKVPNYLYSIDDATTEAAEAVAGAQNGMFNIVSAEAESINVIVGSVYGDGAKKQNFNMLLKAWDGEEMSSARIGRKGYNGPVKGSVAVIAQYDSVNTILAAGASGRGLAERFLLLSEPSRLGERTFGKKRTEISELLTKKYKILVSNLVNSKPVLLNIDELSWLLIEKEREKYEKRMARGGDLVSNMMIGFAGKANKQIMKIASVLHACEHWCEGGKQSSTIGYQCVARAITIFDKLVTAYSNAADNLGHSGFYTEMNALIEYIEYKASKGVYSMRYSQLRSNIKNKNAFRHINNFSEHLQHTLLPELERLNYIALGDTHLFFNRKL